MSIYKNAEREDRNRSAVLLNDAVFLLFLHFLGFADSFRQLDEMMKNIPKESLSDL